MGTSAVSLHSSIHSGAIQPAPCSNNLSTRRSRRALIAAFALLPTLSVAAPIVVEETAKIPSPDPTLSIFPVRLAVEGDTIIATGLKHVYEQEDETTSRDWEYHYAYQFQRQSNGKWQYVKTLTSIRCDVGEVGESSCLASVAIRNGVAVVSADKVHVYERQGTGNWIEVPSDNYSGPGEAAVGTGVVLTSQINGCTFNSEAMRKNSAGTWSNVFTFPGYTEYGCDNWGYWGEDIDISAGNRVITVDTASEGDTAVNVFEPSGSTWTLAANLTPPANSYMGGEVAIDDSRAFVVGSFEQPVHVFDRNAGAWNYAVNIGAPDSIRTGSPGVIKVRDLIIAGLSGDPHRGGSVAVYKRTSTNRYQQVARLVASDPPAAQWRYLGWGDVDAEVSGTTARVIAGATDGLYVYDLKKWGTTAAPQQENFEAGASHWTPMAGSTFSVVTSGESKVYRQSSVAGDAGSFVTSIDWTNQAIEVDVKPTSFNGTNRWTGLAVRRTDASNYYYAALYQSNELALKRMQNGAFVTLASVALPVVLNRTYRLRLEAIGTLLRVYVDGRLALEKFDTALTHGHAGVRMYKTAADFDNVIVSQNPHLTLLDEHNNPYVIDYHWNYGPGIWSVDYSSGNPRIKQQNASGDASAVTVVNANDQIVQTRATLNSFASGTGSRWFGVMARYVDAANYYYVTVRRENTISLRKMVNGTITILDTAPFTVTPGSTYTLRLEAIGSSLRAYVNGTLLVEASDTTHKSGKYGLVMYSAKATYEDFTAWEP